MSGAGGGKARFQLQGKGKVKAPKPAVTLPQTPQQLEQVLCALLAPDNAAIQAATVVLTAFLKVRAHTNTHRRSHLPLCATEQ